GHPTAALTLVGTSRSFHGYAPRHAWPSRAASDLRLLLSEVRSGSRVLVCAPTAAGMLCVASAHPSALGGAAEWWSSCRAPSQCQATTVPPQSRAALPRNANRRLLAASTPLSIRLPMPPGHTPT